GGRPGRRAGLRVAGSGPAGRGVVGLERKVGDGVGGRGAPAPDPELAARLQTWKQKHDEALGEKLVYTRGGIDANSQTLFTWYGRAIRERAGADVAVLNRKGFRGGVQPGPITAASVYSVMPFDNSIMTVKVKGKDLITILENPAAVYDGAVKKGNSWTVKGKALEPDATYTVATFESLYLGGDNFRFERLDPNPNETGVVAQTPVIEWTRKQGTTQDKPLESILH